VARAVAEDASAGLVLLRNASDGGVLPGLRVRCTSQSLVTTPVPLQAGPEGELRLPFGQWDVDATGANCLPVARVDVGSVPVVAWLWPAVSLRVRVRDPSGRPVAGARVSVVRDAATESFEHTDVDGLATLRQVLPTPDVLLLATHPEFLPAMRSLPGNLPMAESTAESAGVIEVALEPGAEPRVVSVVDDLGMPIEGATIVAKHPMSALPEIPVGTTDARGRFLLRGLGAAPALHWDLAGAAYGIRCSAPVAGDQPIVLVAPRSCGALLSLAGRVDVVEWRFFDPKPAASGFGILHRTAAHVDGQREVPVRLPLRKPITIEGVGNDRVHYRTTLVVDADGQVIPLPVAEEPAAARRRMSIRSLGSPILEVTCDGRSLRSVPSSPVAEVTLEVPRTAISLRVTTHKGTQYQLIGQAGAADAALTIDDPVRVQTSVRLVDKDEHPVVDAVLVMAMVGNQPIAADAPGWMVLLEGNRVRLPVDSRGEARGSLPVGTYQAEIEQLPGRDSFGFGLPGNGGGPLVVAGPGPSSFQVVVARPRRIRITLEPGASRVPAWWQLQTSSGTAELSGPSAVVWAGDAADTLRVLDGEGHEIGLAPLAAGSQPVDILVPIRIVR